MAAEKRGIRKDKEILLELEGQVKAAKTRLKERVKTTDFTSRIKMAAARTWTTANEKILINFLRENEVLWNPNDAGYYKRDVRHRLLTQLVNTLANTGFHVSNKSASPKGDYASSVRASEQITDRRRRTNPRQNTTEAKDVKDKIKILRTSYTREIRKEKTPEARAGYKSKWQHFHDMGFLAGVVKSDLTAPPPQMPTDGFEVARSSCSDIDEALVPYDSRDYSIEMEHATDNNSGGGIASPPSDILEAFDKGRSAQPYAYGAARRRATSEKLAEAKFLFFTEAAQMLVARQQQEQHPDAGFLKHIASLLDHLPLIEKEKAKCEIHQLCIKYLEMQQI